MNSLLICLLNSFPFGKGEEFFENELFIASESFEKIILVTTGDITLHMRSVPENVVVIAIDEGELSFKGGAIIHFLRFFVLWCKDVSIRPKQLYKRAKAILDYWKIYKIQYFKWKRIQKKINLKEQFLYKNVFFYDYWFANNFLLIKWWRQKFSYKTFYFSRAHRYDLYDEIWGAPLPFRNLLMTHINNVFPCSVHGQNYLRKKINSRIAGKVKCSYLGTPDYGLGEISKNNTYTIVSCSSLLERKKVERIVDVLAMIQEDQISMSWIHFGDGPRAEYIKNYAERKLPKVSFSFMGHIDNKIVLQYYKMNPIDLFISMSESEGLPVSMMEAISFGIPILAVNCMGISEIVNDVTGAIASPFEEDILIAHKIKNILISTSRNIERRKEIRTFWQEKFSLENFKNFYSQIKSTYNQES